MKTIPEAIADDPPADRPIQVACAEYVDLVDSIKSDPDSEMGKQHLIGSRKAAESLRGGNVAACYPTAANLKVLLAMRPNGKPVAASQKPPAAAPAAK